MPATINQKTGQTENLIQGKREIRFALPGESNYKTRKLMKKNGQWENEQGTRLANIHAHTERLDTTDIDPDAIVLHYGARRKMSDLQGLDGDLARAINKALAIVQDIESVSSPANSEAETLKTIQNNGSEVASQ